MSKRSSISTIETMTTSSTVSTSSQKWADTPFPLISSTRCTELVPPHIPADHACIFYARQMSLIHNTMIRALNAVYNQCLSIKTGSPEAADFLLYNRTLFQMLDHHHKVEEDYMFPEIEKLLGEPGAMKSNVLQHHAFEEGLKLYEKYVTITRPDEFNGRTFMHIIDSFGTILVQHLHDEIPTLLALHTLESADMMRVWKTTEHLANRDVDPYTNWPFTMGCQDATFELDGEVRPWPPAPFFAPVLIKLWFSRRNCGSWRFSPCDFAKRPRKLMFAS